MTRRRRGKNLPVRDTANNSPLTPPPAVDMEEKPKIACPAFKANGSLEISQWIKYFNKKCAEKEIKEKEKCTLVSEFLDEETLSFYITECMDCERWEEITQKLSDHFTVSRDCTFEDFVNTKFHMFPDLMAYFNKKCQIGKKLGLDEGIIVESLSHGLSQSYRDIMNSRELSTTSDWIRVARRINMSPEPQPTQQQPRTSQRPSEPPRFEPRRYQYQPPPRYSHQYRGPAAFSQATRHQNPRWNRPTNNFR